MRNVANGIWAKFPKTAHESREKMEEFAQKRILYIVNFHHTDWAVGIKRRTNSLYNRPISGRIEYMVINSSEGGECGEVDRYDIDRLESKLTDKVGINGKLWAGETLYPNWAFLDVTSSPPDRYMESPGEPISRTMDRLGNLNVVVQKEPGKCLQNAEGLWGWLLGGSNDLSKVDRILNNIEL